METLTLKYQRMEKAVGSVAQNFAPLSSWSASCLSSCLAQQDLVFQAFTRLSAVAVLIPSHCLPQRGPPLLFPRYALLC